MISITGLLLHWQLMSFGHSSVLIKITTSKSWRVNQHMTWSRVLYPWSQYCLAEGYRKWASACGPLWLGKGHFMPPS